MVANAPAIYVHRRVLYTLHIQGNGETQWYMLWHGYTTNLNLNLLIKLNKGSQILKNNPNFNFKFEFFGEHLMNTRRRLVVP